MLSTIVHRGPDDRGVWHTDSTALGQQRLTIIDLTRQSHQPMLTADGKGVIVYNGEVYNYLDLRYQLEQEGVSFNSSGDTEVVLQALHHWGPEIAIPRLNGMFGLAYFDRRDNSLWLARDRMGIKPLVVADTGSELIFASEVKALLAHPNMQRRIDDRALTMRLLERHQASHKFLFGGVEGIEAGNWWHVTDSGVKKHCYFNVLEHLDVPRLVGNGKLDTSLFINQFSEILRNSVKMHLASDVPLAAMVSGGVDSSLIAAYMRNDVPNLEGYVADFSWEGAEGAHAEQVGKHLGLHVNRVHIDREEYLRLWPLTIWHHDGVPFHQSDPAMLAVARRCRKDGIKVLLTGEGSDELFGGYDWYQKTWNNWNKLFGRFYQLHRKKHLIRKRKRLELSPFSNMKGSKDKSMRKRLLVSLDANAELLPNRIMDLLEPVQPIADRALLANGFSDLYDHLSWILFRHDRIGMAASMEMRVPFIENSMIDFAMHLPKQAKVKNKIGKWVVKKEAENYLPKASTYMKKKGFPIPGFLTAGTQELLRNGMLPNHFSWKRSTQEEVIELAKEDVQLRYHLVGMEMWFRIFFDGQTSEELGEKLIKSTA
jgi:asparagine synthase (glutamine-hydrolysing)